MITSADGVRCMVGLSPRLSHVVETMAGTQRRGDTPKFRPPPVENRQRFRADSVSLGEGLRCAFAHENRGPTPEQVAAIHADMAEHERRQAELERRMAEEQEGRSKLLLRDRLEREERARKALAAKYPERHVASGILNHDNSRRRQWQVLEPNDSTTASPGVIFPARHLGGEVVHVEPSVMMVPQQGHNVEERLFASRPSFTPKAQRAPSPQATLPPPSEVQIQMPAQRPPAPQAGTPPILIQLGSSRMKMSRPLSPAPVAPTGGGPMLTPAGIGISFVRDQDGNLLIAHLVPGGPAMLSGQLYIGDRLISVSGQPVAGKTVPEVIRMILGPKDSEVRERMGTSSSERAGVRACWRAGVRASERAWVVTNLNIQNKKVRLEVITPAAGPGVREVSIVRAAPSFVPRPSTLSRLSPGSTAPMSQVRMQCILIAGRSSMPFCCTAFLLTAMLFHCFSANSHVAFTRLWQRQNVCVE